MSENYNLRNIQFGFSRAETERTEAPSLLMERYFDELGLIDSALDGPTFLFLGNKGAGKSALVNHLDLQFQNKYNNFSTIYQLEDFSFSNFSKIIRGDQEPESKFPDAWAWILLIISLESLSRDQGVLHPDPNAYQQTIKSLKEMGFMPQSSLRHIANLTSKKTFKLNIPYVFEANDEYIKIEKVNDIPMFVHNMKKMICNARTTSKHIIMLDGLDDILTTRSVQYKSLGSLVFEVDRMNDLFKQNNVNIKFIIVCRIDLYEKISGANKNKIRQDKCKYIDWYKNPRNPDRSLLFDMVNKKTGLPGDFFAKYFNFKIFSHDAPRFLLDHTRHTPRDFLMALKKIAELQKDGERLTQNLVLSGLRIYSTDYFVGEIEDELEGYTRSNSPKDWVEFIGMFGKRRISMKEIERKCSEMRYDASELHQVLKALFECSAIGTVINSGNGEHYTFRYRNRNSNFVVGNDISIHVGLRKALNIP
ncbi:P-loop ATPase, Sll1717 family [Allorhizobium sp. NPDC080224]|uniref:P-loop ATPase, Sll1717 family n=1 Tax=Allorhizobium sp. NPDC080224 TaxID=3390547 RepID=UPI003CFC0429